MPKAQMHFEVDHELKAHWKAFFALLPRKSETRILTELMRNFLEKAKKQYLEEEETPPESLQRIEPFNVLKEMEIQNDPRTDAVDQSGNREGVHDESGVEELGSDRFVTPEQQANPEDPGTQS